MSRAQSLFETERVRVRSMNEADVANLERVYGDRDAMRYVGDGEPITHDECVRWVEVTERNMEERGYGMSAVEDLDGRLIGFCGLVHPGGQTEAEIKYALLREHWGKGLATEIVGAMIDYGVERFGLDEVIATVDPGNAASARVLEKCGFARAEPRIDDDGSTTDVFRWSSP